MVAGLVDRVMRRMRAAHRVGRTVVLRLRFGDFSRATRSHTLEQATGRTDAVLEAARLLLVAAGPLIAERQAPTHGAADEADVARESALDAALDGVRDRFGSAAVTRGVLLRHGEGLEVPLLPD